MVSGTLASYHQSSTLLHPQSYTDLMHASVRYGHGSFRLGQPVGYIRISFRVTNEIRKQVEHYIAHYMYVGNKAFNIDSPTTYSKAGDI